ncbi:hypothetical protein [Streptomyces sp. L2]|uniref:hypothetical protein n=1 Tax=Streptomyces sp. L2 TaxID=2162665 RepID=UPI0010124B77|nr:hypothetical protein [Streptomyces sp. L2]
MNPIVSRARYERDIAVLRAETARLRRERDNARDECGAYKVAATTAARQVIDAEDAPRLIEGGRVHISTPSEELARARAQARALEKRLAELTAANQACTCQRWENLA